MNSLSERPREERVCRFIASTVVGPCCSICSLDNVAPPEATNDVESGAATVNPPACASEVVDRPG